MKKNKWRADSEVRTSIKKLKMYARLHCPAATMVVKVEENVEPEFWTVQVKCEHTTFEDVVKRRQVASVLELAL